MFVKTYASTVNFVRRNKTRILVGALAATTTAAVLTRIALKEHDEFLKEHDLYDEYYTPIED